VLRAWQQFWQHIFHTGHPRPVDSHILHGAFMPKPLERIDTAVLKLEA
jgi:hypothetical protein